VHTLGVSGGMLHQENLGFSPFKIISNANSRFEPPAANLVQVVANLPLSTQKVPSQYSRGTITAHSYRLGNAACEITAE